MTQPQTSHQGSLWAVQHMWKQSILAKLREAYRHDLVAKTEHCHTLASILRCRHCGRSSEFMNRCEIFWCPVCQPRLHRERVERVRWWSLQIQQPKHMVLTARNTSTIHKSRVDAFKKAFGQLRRSKFAEAWRGGTWSLEVTNEGRGWHLHLHSLVDADWISGSTLAKEWAKRLGQDFAIVKVKDARAKEYLLEVTKYTCKPNQLSSWDKLDIAAYIDAFSSGRNFGVFGMLHGKQKEWRDFLKAQEQRRQLCECGSTSWEVTDATTLEARELACQPCEPKRLEAPLHHPELFETPTAIAALSR